MEIILDGDVYKRQTIYNGFEEIGSMQICIQKRYRLPIR